MDDNLRLLKERLEENFHLIDQVLEQVDPESELELTRLLEQRSELIRAIPVNEETKDLLEQLLQINQTKIKQIQQLSVAVQKKMRYANASKSAVKQYKGISKSE
jgi:hypothetical protein